MYSWWCTKARDVCTCTCLLWIGGSPCCRISRWDDDFIGLSSHDGNPCGSPEGTRWACEDVKEVSRWNVGSTPTGNDSHQVISQLDVYQVLLGLDVLALSAKTPKYTDLSEASDALRDCSSDFGSLYILVKR